LFDFSWTPFSQNQIGAKFPQSRPPPFPARRCDQVVQSFDNVETKAKKNKAHLVKFAADSHPHAVLGVGA
jgi:hypothetical protein